MANHFRIIKDQKEDLYEILTDFLENDNAVMEEVDVHINLYGKLEKRTILRADYPRNDFFLRMMTHHSEEQNQRILSFYPCSNNGIISEVVIKEINEQDYGAEARISAEINGNCGFEFFDTSYLIYKHSYCTDESYNFSFYGISTYITKWDEKDVEELSGTNENTESRSNKDCRKVYFSADGKKLLIDKDAGIPDEYVFNTTIEKAETLNYQGKVIYRIKCGILNTETETNFLKINLYASDKTIRKGYIPKPGDCIKGHLWLCGFRDEDLPF